MRVLGFGAIFAAGMAMLFSPLGSGVILLLMVYQLGAVIVSLVVDGPDLAYAAVPALVHVERVVAGPHAAPIARHGKVVSVVLHNSSGYRHTAADDGNHGAPLWLSCAIGGNLARDGVLLGHYNRVVVMKLDWIVGADGDPTFPILAAGETKTMDFSTVLDWDFTPIAANEQIGACQVGSDKAQALLLGNLDIADQNRGNSYHYSMTSVTSAGRELGYTASP
jgi:hypothetical protein